MTETNSTEHAYVFHDGLHSVGPVTLWLFKIAATFMLATIIVASWSSFPLISKFLAVILMADILFSPTFDRWREKRAGRKLESSVVELNGYRWLILVCVLLLPMFLPH